MAEEMSSARGDVRGLVAKLAAHVRPTCSELWDEAQAFLAAEGVQAEPKAESQLTYKGVPIGPMQTFADIERQASAHVGAAEDMVLDAIERRESSAPVGVEGFEARLRGRAGPFTAQPGERYVDADIALAVLREALAQQPAADPRSTHRVWRGDDWQPCYCEATNDHRIGSEQPAAADGSGAQAAEIEALRAEAAEAAKVLRGALDARTDGEPLRVLANRASNALYWRNERAERAEARAERLAEALRHQRWCRTCAEDGWESCEEGRKNDALLRDQED